MQDSKRHRGKEQTVGLCGRRWGWDDLKEQYWNMYITICEIDDQSKFDAWNRALKASALWQPRGKGWGGRSEEASGWGTHVHSWLIHVNIWQKPPQYCKIIQFSSVQSLSRVWLFVTPWITARQASLSITNSWSSPKCISIESGMASSHLILCRPLLLLPPIPPSIRVFSNESTFRIVAKVLEFQPQHQSFQ